MNQNFLYQKSFLYGKVSKSLMYAIMSVFIIGSAKAQVLSNCSYEPGTSHLLKIDGLPDSYCLAFMTCNVNGKTYTGNTALCKALYNKSMNPCPQALECAKSKDPKVQLTGYNNPPSDSPAFNTSGQYQYRSRNITLVNISGPNNYTHKFCMGDGVSKSTGQRKLIFFSVNMARSGWEELCYKLPPDTALNNSQFHHGFQIQSLSNQAQPASVASGLPAPASAPGSAPAPGRTGSATPKKNNSDPGFRSRIGFR